jgi:hypothetical protein
MMMVLLEEAFGVVECWSIGVLEKRVLIIRP